MSNTTAPTAALLIIGNEILSGRTKDANLAYLGEKLAGLGIRLQEVRVVADIEQDIIDALNALRTRYGVVFTTGGIGPTHDDITSACVAKAFGRKLIRHPDAVEMLRKYYQNPEDLNEARLKMTEVPEGATLVANPVSAAPGYRYENVYVFAGVPRIMQAMFDNIAHELVKGEPIQSRTVTAFLTEGVIAEKLTAIQNGAGDAVDIGSYPLIKSGRLGTSLVMRGTDAAKLDETYAKIRAMILSLNGEFASEE